MTYVAAEETTQHAPGTSDMRFKCVEREGIRSRYLSHCRAFYIE